MDDCCQTNRKEYVFVLLGDGKRRGYGYSRIRRSFGVCDGAASLLCLTGYRPKRYV